MRTTSGVLVFETNPFFSGTLAENNRLRLVHNVVIAFGKLMSAARGEVLCSITTAKVCNESLLLLFHYCTFLQYQVKRAVQIACILEVRGQNTTK